MLSPASHRVCCLAVMAPALTKADRQADCLPVVLSESFCVSKTPDRFNGIDRISEIRLKCAFSSEYLQNKRKSFMHRACWRTQRNGPGFLNKYRSVYYDSAKSLLSNGRVRTQREAKHKTWQSTNATTAYADKIKLKYTMSKHTTNVKNMGLAKANTSLGLQNLKGVKQFKENQNSGPNVMEDSMNFSDSADSSMQMGPIVSNISVLATNSDSDVSPVESGTVPCVPNHGKASDSSLVSDAVQEKAVSESVLENDSQLFLVSVDADTMGATDTSVILTDFLCSTTENVESNKKSPSSPNFQVTDVPVADLEVTSQDSAVLQSSVNVSPFHVLEQSESGLPSEVDTAISSKSAQNSMFTKCMDLKLPVLNSKYSGGSVLASSLFSSVKSSELLMNALKLSDRHETEMKYPVLTDHRYGLQYLRPVRKEENICCLPSSQELESLEMMLADKLKSVKSVLVKSTHLLQKQMNVHAKKQICSLVEHYQRKYQIPCQRPTKHVNIKTGKELVDLKAELLQSEDVKNMSTAALVNLVRKLESSGSQAKILSPKASVVSNSPMSSEDVALNFDPEDCEDVKKTSGVMISNIRNLLKLSDPYFTDSSEEEYDSETEDEEIPDNNSVDNKSALWKYLAGRTVLGSSSTWLLARIHELEYRIKEFVERWNEVVKTEGKVCLEEPVASHNSEFSIPGSDNASLQTSVKQTAMKSFLLPLNGFLDRSDISHIAKTTTSKSFPHEFDDPNRTESDTEVEGFCCRTQPLNISVFRKRKLAFIPGLHATNPKFSRLSTVNCNCNSRNELAPCILCTGQYNSIQSIDPHSMALRDRIAILDPYFHPALSTEKDIPSYLCMENVLKIQARRYVRPVSPEPNATSEVQHGVRPKLADLRSHRKLSRYARTLSAKYRNKRHRNVKHLRKHNLLFGKVKWRPPNKHLLQARKRFRRHSVASSGSSPDSPVHSPMSVFEDGSGYEKKRRDDSQFDIDDVIIPCNSKSGRLVEIQYKEIMIPSWRTMEDGASTSNLHNMEDAENITDVFLIKRHDKLEAEEKEKVKRTALGLNRRRRNRCDSRADSSGANTPDPMSSYNQGNVFQTPSFAIAGPSSPASPPATLYSGIVSDDSQPAFSSSVIRPEKKKLLINQKQPFEESTLLRNMMDFDEVLPYEPLKFPLSDEIYEQLLTESDHNKEVLDIPSYSPDFPESPISSSSSTSTVEDEEEDITDPEWTVVKPMRNGPDQTLVLKFAKR